MLKDFWEDAFSMFFHTALYLPINWMIFMSNLICYTLEFRIFKVFRAMYVCAIDEYIDFYNTR